MPDQSPNGGLEAPARVAGGVPLPVAGAAEQQSDRTAILVLGMHRSGTSFCTSALAAAGVDVGTDHYAADRHNQRGYWELVEVNRTHEAILRAAGSRWDDWRRFSFPDAAAEAHGRQALRDAVARCFPNSRLFAIKDPRSCRIASLWRDVLESLGVVPKIVVPVRHPDEVAASLKARDGMPAEKGLLLWMRHVLDALQQTRGLPTAVVHYAELLADPHAAIERIGTRLSIRWPVGGADLGMRLAAVTDPALRHHVHDPRRSSRPSCLPLVDRLWNVLESGSVHEDPGAVEAIEKEFTTAIAPFENYVWELEESREQLLDAVAGLRRDVERAQGGSRSEAGGVP